MNKSKWEINPTEDFDTEFEKILSFLTRELHKNRKIIFELCILERKNEMHPGCMKTLRIL